MADLTILRQELIDRLDSAQRLTDVGESTVGTASDISRETRGLAIVLMFAAYENLVMGVCRSVLEEVSLTRSRNRRLKPGFKLFATHAKFRALYDSGPNQLWTGRGLALMELATSTKVVSVDPEVFPKDGSFMKKSQISVLCTLFEFGDPAPVLKQTWALIETIVRNRNDIAHGARRADEVGREFTYNDICSLISTWRNGWDDFLTWVEVSTSTSSYYLLPR